MTISASEAATLLAQLLTSAARTIVLAAFAGVLLIAFRAKATSVRLFTWTTVLYAGLSMPILGGMLPSVEVGVPFVMPRPTKVSDGRGSVAILGRAAHPLTIQAEEIVSATDSNISLEITKQAGREERSSWVTSTASIPWTTVAVCAYFATALFLLARLITGIWFARRLVRSSILINDPRVHIPLASWPYPSNRLCRLRVRESQAASVPLTVGVYTPTIVLPSSWREWDDDKLAGVLTHEMSHVERRDCLSQYVSLLHRAIFWFSPLAWWLNRHVIELAEQASDEEVLSRGTDQNRYARMLLGFLENAQAAPGRIRWQGVAMASSGRAEKRLEKVLAWKGDKKMNPKKSALIAVVAIAIPASFLAAASRPVSPGQSVSSSGPTQAGPAAPAIPAIPAAVPGPQTPGAAGSAIAAPQSPVTPGPPQEAVSAGNHHHGFSYRNGYDDEQRFVIVSGKSNAVTMSGSSEDAGHAERLKQRIPGDFIWFQRDEKSYIIRDQATVDHARQLWAPQEELGRKQEELGKQQEALGKQQQELGARMQAVRVKIPDMTGEIDKLKAELKQLGPDATVEQIGRIQSEIGQLQSRIGEIQSHAGEEQGKLGDEMGALGEKQGKLGEQQGELGRQQGELAEKAIREMKQLLDDAIKKGTAQPESPEPGGASL